MRKPLRTDDDLRSFVCEQRKEIVEFGALLAIVRQNIKDLEDKCGQFDKWHNLTERFCKLEDKINIISVNLNSRYDLINLGQNRLNEQINNISQDLNLTSFISKSNAENLSNHKKYNEKLHKEHEKDLANVVSEITTSINSKESNLNNQFTVIASQVMKLNEDLLMNIEKMSGDYQTLISRYSDQKNRITILESYVKQLQDQINNLQAQNSAVR